MRHWWVILAVAVWLSAMGCALSQAFFSPDLLRVTEPIVCPAGTEMDVQTPRYSYHRPGEYSIEISCVGPLITKDVTAQAELVYWSIWLLPSLPVAALGTVLTTRWWRNRRAQMIAGMGEWVTRMGSPTVVVNRQTLEGVDVSSLEVRQALERAMEVLADEDNDGMADVLEGVVQSGAQVVDLRQASRGTGAQRLRELREMVDGGLITQEEYEAKKAEILEEM